MKTKNDSVFAPNYVLVSRKDYDSVLVAKDETFLHHLFATYARSWSLAGVKFYNLNSKDFVKIFKLLV
jgi:hypothetical protein